MSVIVSRFTIFTENLVICCFQVTKIFCTRYGSVIGSSARGPCNFGPVTDLAISVFGEMSFNTVLTQISELARPESADNGLPRSIMVSFLFVIGSFWLAWSTTGCHVLSSTLELDIGAGDVSLSVRSSFSRVSLSLDIVVLGEEDELEEDVEQGLSCLEGVLEVE